MTAVDSPPVSAPFADRLVGPELQHQVEQFLYFEAELLDDRRFDEWVDLLTDDIRYYAPVRTNRLMRELQHENTGPGMVANFDDDRMSIGWRLGKLASGASWGEDPPSRTRRLVSNVRIRRLDPSNEEGDLEVRSNLVLYRNRLEVELDVFGAERTDILRGDGPATWRLARRRILIDQGVILAKNLSVFF